MAPTPVSTVTVTGEASAGTSASGRPSTPPGPLATALERFETAGRDSIMGSRQVINALLDLWADARAEGPEVAEPVERLLTRLVARQYTTPAELDVMTDAVRLAAAHR